MVFSSSGNSLIQVMIAMAVMSVLTVGIMTVMDSGNREVKSLQQKIDIVQSEQDLMRDLSDPAVCSCNFDSTKNTTNGSPLVFDSTSATSEITLARIFGGCLNNIPSFPIAVTGQPLPAAQSGVRVSSIKLKNFQPTSVGRFKAALEVTFDNQTLEVARKPASVNVSLSADLTNPALAKITSCTSGKDIGSGGGSGVTCPSQNYTYGSQAYSVPDGPAGAYYLFGVGLRMATPPCDQAFLQCEYSAGNLAWSLNYGTVCSSPINSGP